MSINRIMLCLLALLSIGWAQSSSQLILAQNGQALFDIIGIEPSSVVEKNAVQELAAYLQEISRAPFAI